MNDDLLYQELLDNPRFVSWVLNGDPQDDAYWQRWKLESPHNAEILESARLTVRAIHGRKLVMTDEQVEGLSALFGRGVYHCPFCHGWETGGMSLAVLGHELPQVMQAHVWQPS